MLKHVEEQGSLDCIDGPPDLAEGSRLIHDIMSSTNKVSVLHSNKASTQLMDCVHCTSTSPAAAALRAEHVSLQVLRMAISGSGRGRAKSLRAIADTVSKTVEAMQLSSGADPQEVCSDQPLVARGACQRRSCMQEARLLSNL